MGKQYRYYVLRYFLSLFFFFFLFYQELSFSLSLSLTIPFLSPYLSLLIPFCLIFILFVSEVVAASDTYKLTHTGTTAASSFLTLLCATRTHMHNHTHLHTCILFSCVVTRVTTCLSCTHPRIHNVSHYRVIFYT